MSEEKKQTSGWVPTKAQSEYYKGYWARLKRLHKTAKENGAYPEQALFDDPMAEMEEE